LKTIQIIGVIRLVLPREKPYKFSLTVLCQPCNPGGITCYAFIIKDDKNTIHRDYGLAEHNSTNNVAEYTGIIKALQWLITNKYENEKIIVRGDSQLIVSQIKESSR
jgi:ribonuclease HI